MYATQLDYGYGVDAGYETYEEPVRASDIPLPPAVEKLLLAAWLAIAGLGLLLILVLKNPVLGAVIISVPTFVGMVLKPSFGLCILMLVLPTGTGVGYGQIFTLNRAVGLAVGVSFVLNYMITRPKLHLSNRALIAALAYTLWILATTAKAPHIRLELTRSFTQVQLLGLFLIIYWVLSSNGYKAFMWALRSFVVGTLGTVALTFITGAALRSMSDSDTESRYAATLGQTVNANLLAGLTAMAFLAAIYLFARDKKLFWRLLYGVAFFVLPVMLIRIGSRGALVAMAVTLVTPLFFVRQSLRRPIVPILVLAVLLVSFLSIRWFLQSNRLADPVAERLTSVSRAQAAVEYRLQPIRKSMQAAVSKPLGTSFWGWFEWSGLRILPHSDFFLVLGCYGLPGALLFLLFLFSLAMKVRGTPLSMEKLYTRAVLTYLMVIGLNNAFLFQKFYWIFMAFVVAGVGVAKEFAESESGQDQYLQEYEEQYV